MAATARKFEMEAPMHAQTSLEATVNLFQEDVTGLKADVKRLDAKIDVVGASLTEHRLDTEKSFGRLRNDMTAAIGALRVEIGALRGEMKDALAKSRSISISQLAWFVSTLIAATGVAFTAAKFFSTR